MSFTDAGKYSGVSLRFRWNLGTDGSSASTGWFVDDIVLTGVFPIPPNDPPVILSAVADPATVTGQSTSLLVSADDDGGEPSLTYAWSQTGGPATAVLIGGNTDECTATFSSAGNYVFRISVSDAEGLITTEDVEVTVDATPTVLAVSPPLASVQVSNQQAFAATVSDQFGDPITPTPTVSWSVNGGGSVGTDGVFTAGAIPGGPFTVTASSGALSDQATLHITGVTYESWQTAHFTPEEISEGAADDLADPDGDGLSNLLEYALGIDPTEGNPIPFTCEWKNDGPEGVFRIATFTRPAGLPGLDLVIEGNTDLHSAWTQITDYETEIDGAWEIITVRVPDVEGQPRFLRFQVTRDGP